MSHEPSPIRIGILGASQIAPLAVIEPARRRRDVVIQAVAARERVRAARFAAAHGIPVVADDYDALLAMPLDLVYIALPPDRLARWSIAASRAGKAVLCEKPFATTSAEAVAMISAADAAGRPLLEAMHHRFHPAFGRLLGLVASGAVGSVEAVDVAMSSAGQARRDGFRWRAIGGGVLLDLGCYAVHTVRALAGDALTIVDANASWLQGCDVRFEATVRAAGSSIDARIALAMDGDEIRQMLRVVGDDGAIVLPWFAMSQDGDRICIERDGRVRHEEPVGAGSTFDHQLAHVVAVLRGRAESVTGGQDALANVRTLEALKHAALSKDLTRG